MATYTIDSIDLATLGFDVEKVTGLESIPGRKGETFQSWDDESGIEPFVEADDIVLNERTVTISMLLRVTSTQSGQSKLQVLEGLLHAEGLRTLEVSYISSSFVCYCKSAVESTRLTNIVVDEIVYRVIVKLIESS